MADIIYFARNFKIFDFNEKFSLRIDDLHFVHFSKLETNYNFRILKIYNFTNLMKN